MEKNKILTTKEVCEAFKITPVTLNAWRRQGLPYEQVNKRIFKYDSSEVIKWLDKNKRYVLDRQLKNFLKSATSDQIIDFSKHMGKTVKNDPDSSELYKGAMDSATAVYILTIGMGQIGEIILDLYEKFIEYSKTEEFIHSYDVSKIFHLLSNLMIKCVDKELKGKDIEEFKAEINKINFVVTPEEAKETFELKKQFFKNNTDSK